jgi:hypothetical protein
LGNSDLGSLDQLNAAMGKWLNELERETSTSSTQIRGNNSRVRNFDRMDTASMPLDGKLVSLALLKQIHVYEKDWNQCYDQAEDPDQLAVPFLTKEILADIIKQCPALEKIHAPRSALSHETRIDKYHSTDWLWENVGARFLTPKAGGRIRAGIRLRQGVQSVSQSAISGDSSFN